MFYRDTIIKQVAHLESLCGVFPQKSSMRMLKNI